MSKRPEFIACLDLTAGTGGGGWFVKAMEERDIIDAMKRLDSVIQERPNHIYIANLFRRVVGAGTGKHTRYEAVLMARVNAQYPYPVKWIRRCAENRETPWGLATWVATDDDRHGYLQFEDGGTLGL